AMEADCILRPMRRTSKEGRFAERVVSGVDDLGAEERIVIWIERKPGGVWAVGRAVNPQHRSSDAPRQDDYVFEGYELEDALERVGLVVDVVDVHAERLGKVGLEQAVVPDDLERDPLARGREGDAAVGLVVGELERGELLHHRARGRRRDAERPRERRHGR